MDDDPGTRPHPISHPRNRLRCTHCVCTLFVLVDQVAAVSVIARMLLLLTKCMCDKYSLSPKLPAPPTQNPLPQTNSTVIICEF